MIRTGFMFITSILVYQTLGQPERNISPHKPVCASPAAHKRKPEILGAPPMGWMTWQHYRCAGTNENIVQQAITELSLERELDIHTYTSFKDAGYDYVFIDDCWMAKARVSEGLVADSDAFSNGIPPLVEAAEKAGLKLGLYTSVGRATCEQRPASQFHFAKDNALFKEWRVRGLKVDGCNFVSNHQDQCVPHDFFDAYIKFGNAIHDVNEDFYFSCSWPAYQDSHGLADDAAALKELGTVCHSWRNFGDIGPSEHSMELIIDYWAANSAVQPYGPASVEGVEGVEEFRIRAPLLDAAGPGRWNDADQLLIGEKGVPLRAQRRQMSIWAIIASPLFLSTEIGAISDESRALALNKAVIAVNQDILAIQGHVAFKNEIWRVWVRRVESLAPRVFAIVIENLSNDDSVFWIPGTSPSLRKLLDPLEVVFDGETDFGYEDLWNHTIGCVGVGEGCATDAAFAVSGKDVVMLRVEKIN